MEYSPFNTFDMVAVSDKISLFRKDNLSVECDDSKKEKGIVSLKVEHPMKRDGTFIIYEIHKTEIKRFIGKKNIWLVQIYSQQSSSSKLTKIGCCSGKSQIKAIYAADKDIYDNYDNELTLTQAYELETTGSTT